MEKGSHLFLNTELQNLADKMGFSLINGKTEIDQEYNKVEIVNQQEFIDLHQHIENKLLFYDYGFEYAETYIIPDEYHQLYREDIFQAPISMKIHEYNKKLKEIDFEKPANLLLFYLKEGFLFFNYFSREEIESLSPSEDTIESLTEVVIQELPVEKIEKVKRDRQIDFENKTQKLKEQVFNDPEFKLSTNTMLRRTYAHQFFKDNPEAEELLQEPDFPAPLIFIENLWREFKAKGLHK